MVKRCIKDEVLPRQSHANSLRDYEAPLGENVSAWIGSIKEVLASPLPTEFGIVELPERVRIDIRSN